MPAETQIELLKKDIEQVKDIHTRLDTAIEKLTDVSTSVKQMLAVHEERIAQQESADRNLFDLVEKRRAETDNKLEDVHSRISTTSRELKEMLYMTEQKLMLEIRSMKTGLADRVGVLEKWRYLLIGGCIILGLILSGNFSMILKMFG